MLKKLCLLALVLVMVFAASITAHAQEATSIFPLSGKLSSQATLLSEPDASATAVKTVAFLTVTVTEQSEDGAWYNVTLEDGTAGWVPTNVVEFTLGEGEAYPRAGKLTGEVIVYSAADDTSTQLERVAFWDVVVLGENADSTWYNVQLQNGAGGWVDAGKVSFVDPAAETTEEEAEATIYENIPVAVGGVNIHELPDVSSPRIVAVSGQSGFAPHVAGKNEDGSWLYIYFFDGGWQDGWVRTYQLEIAELRVSRLPVIDAENPPAIPSLLRNDEVETPTGVLPAATEEAPADAATSG